MSKVTFYVPGSIDPTNAIRFTLETGEDGDVFGKAKEWCVKLGFRGALDESGNLKADEIKACYTHEDTQDREHVQKMDSVRCKTLRRFLMEDYK